MKLAWIALLFLTSCSPSSLHDLRCQGEAETRRLASELKNIETTEELRHSLPRLKKRYNKLADLLVQARKFQLNEASEPTFASEELFAQLARLYEVPGARELIESAQVEAVKKLNRSRLDRER